MVMFVRLIGSCKVIFSTLPGGGCHLAVHTSPLLLEDELELNDL